MIIYRAEQEVNGLAEKVMANCVVAYGTKLELWTKDDRERVFNASPNIIENIRAQGSIDDYDLYYTKSILVTTNWNKNDDVFGRGPVWAARHTPIHKRTNLEHDEKQLVGHITGTWALSHNGDIIPDDSTIDDLPNMYHIANGAVIYTKWEDDELVSRAHSLITQIEAGQKFVSMEAFFSDFDYAIMTPEDKLHIVARQEDTAFLTKHLRVYGGEGQFDGCRLGRLLKNINFCGKGYVDRPANEYSVIFNNAESLDFSSASTKNPFDKQSGVFISCSDNFDDPKKTESTRMSNDISLELLQKQSDEQKATIAELRAKVDEYSKSSVADRIKAHEAKITELEGKLETAVKANEQFEETVSNLTTKNEELEKQLVAANESNTKLEEQLSSVKAEQVEASRVAVLVDGGYDRDEALAKVRVFSNLSDEQFETVATELVSTKSSKDSKDKEDEDDKGKDKDKDKAKSSDDDPATDPNDASANDSVLDSASASDVPNLTADVSNDSDDDSTVRQELVAAFEKHYGYGDQDEDSEDD